jgi:hypothetical protein
MRARLADLNSELESNWGVRLEMRVGVNTGEVVAASPGAAVSSERAATLTASPVTKAWPAAALASSSARPPTGSFVMP